MIHTVRGFSVVNEAEVDVFLKLAFSMIQQMLAIWSLVPLPLLNPACTSGSSKFTYYWNLAWRILSMTLLVYEMNAMVWQFEHSLAWPFFGIGIRFSWSSCFLFSETTAWQIWCPHLPFRPVGFLRTILAFKSWSISSDHSSSPGICNLLSPNPL